MALVDERGCRRDIRSNGWIVFRESSLFQNRSGRRNRFSSFGAESLLRNFTGPKARLKSGPDVFADALVPRNVCRSDCRASGARHLDLSKSFTCRSDRSRLAPAVADRDHAARRISYAARPPIPVGTFANAGCSACADNDARKMRDVAMVIVVRNARVNRTSRILTSCCSTATSAILRRRERSPRLHPVHRDI